MGYSGEPTGYLKGRLKDKGIVHYGKYNRLSSKQLESVVQEYDDKLNHLGLTDNWSEEGFVSYLDWFYTSWSPTFGKKESKEFQERMNEVYTVLQNAGFIESGRYK